MKKSKIIIISIIGVLIIIAIYLLYKFNYIEHKSYSSEYFNIEVVKSDKDYDNDGIEDYKDILDGAKITAKNKVTYKSAYYEGGYPPDYEGVCTDVIWRSLAHAGYNLKELMDEDIANNVEAYPRVDGKPDPNIDFRRVPNQLVFFQRNTEVLTNDIKKIEEWMPGDIVIFSDNHVAIISDKRNSKGIPFLIHNANQFRREDDAFEMWAKSRGITGHFRFNLKEEE